MKYKDYIEKLPQELQDRIFNYVFETHKKNIKKIIQPKTNDLIYKNNINKLMNEFNYYNIPLKLLCCTYSDLNNNVYKFKDN